MNKWKGFVGNILRINLSNNRILEEPLDKETVRRFLGGVGYASKILWDEIEPGIDPLGLKNKLIMTTGPLTGTLCPGSGSWDICFKSPLTNVWGETRCGSSWGPELKYAGYDMVVLEGFSEELV
ncbi:MAG: aldehyde ferredoxin oxidoreductase, partial [Candidatus Bathyarchaeota archaeon]